MGVRTIQIQNDADELSVEPSNTSFVSLGARCVFVRYSEYGTTTTILHYFIVGIIVSDDSNAFDIPLYGILVQLRERRLPPPVGEK